MIKATAAAMCCAAFLTSTAVLAADAPAAGASPATPAGKEALAIIKEAIAVPTVAGRGKVPELAAKLKARLVAGGFADQDVTFTPVGETGYLVARFPGRDRKAKPIVILPHMDVVEARPSDWERDPFTPIVENGYIYGRGASDDKGDLGIVMAALLQLKRSGWVPAQDIVLLVSGDEETQMATVRAAAPHFKDAALVLNADSGGGELDHDNRPMVYTLQAGEKTYADYTLTLTDPGGHSSRPGKTNAIATMGEALAKIWTTRFPAQISALTRAELEGMAGQADPQVAPAIKAFLADQNDADAIATISSHRELIGLIRTTCVPTMITGGHAPNALPQSVTANVNCRIFPGTKRAAVQARLAEIVANPAITIDFKDNGTIESLESPLEPKLVAAVTKAVQQRVPGLKVVPAMSPGATDSMHFRALGVPAYGVSAVFMRAEDNFNHGLNERLPLATLDPGVKQWVTLLKTLAK